MAGIASLCEFTSRVHSKYRYIIEVSDAEALMTSRQYTWHPARWLSGYFPISTLLFYSPPSTQRLSLVQ